MRRGIAIFLLFVFTLSGCVQNKQLVYLQDQNQYTGFTKDSVISQYEMADYEYTLRTSDIISVKIASLTSPEYDFYQRYIYQLGPLVRTPYWFGMPGMQSRGGGGGNNQGQGGQSGGNQNNNQALGSEFQVDSAGYVNLPVIGPVEVKGLTLDQAEQKVQKAAVGFFEDPMVRMNIQNFSVTMLGEVNEEGIVTARDPELNVFEAISMAGNLTEVADRKNVKIVRMHGNQAETIYIDLLDEKLLASENFYLQPGDMVIVPPLKAKQRKQYTLPNSQTILSTLSTALVLILTIDRIGN